MNSHDRHRYRERERKRERERERDIQHRVTPKQHCRYSKHAVQISSVGLLASIELTLTHLYPLSHIQDAQLVLLVCYFKS